MKYDNFEPANIYPSEVDALAALIRRLTYEDWHAAEKVRMYEASPKRGMQKPLDQKES